MPQINFSLGEEEDEIVEALSKKWILSKPETIKRIIREFEVKE